METQAQRHRFGSGAALHAGGGKRPEVSNEGSTLLNAEGARTRGMREGTGIPANGESDRRNGTPGPNLGGLLNIAIEIAEKRRDLLGLMRKALLDRDDVGALSYARELCGVE